MNPHSHQNLLNEKEHDKDTNFPEDFGNYLDTLAKEPRQLAIINQSQSTRVDSNDYQTLLAAAQVRPTDEIDEDQVCLLIENEGKNYVIGTIGNLSTIAGRAKAKKTFTVSFAIAAAVTNKVILNRIKGQLPSDKRTVILFDTEQSRFHVLRVIKRICRLSGIDDPPNLLVYSLRPHTPQDRLKIIDYALKNTPNLGLVVIDGIRDLAVDPVLDAEQASHLMTHLLQWSDRLKIHIMCVLHQNKNDANLRGHIGTELVNKSETVITVSRDTNDKEVSIVAAEYCRDRDFEEFRFSVDDKGLPFLVTEEIRGDNPGLVSAGKVKPNKFTAATMTPDMVNTVINRAFAQVDYLSYGEVLTNIREACAFIGAPLSKHEAEAFIRRILVGNQVVKSRPDKSRWDMYQLNTELSAESV